MTPSGSFVGADDGTWSSVLSRMRRDFYHRPCYASVAARHEGGEAVAFVGRVDGADVLIPVLLREVPGRSGEGYVDALSPYGYPGPVASRPLDAPETERVLRDYIETGRERGVVASFIRCHPILSPREGWGGQEGVDLVRRGPTVAVDLTLGYDEWLQSIRGSHRREIEGLLEEGFTTRLDMEGDDERFRTIYRETMRRVGASSLYLFDDDYFDGLADCLGDDRLLWTVVSPDGEVAAGALFVATGEIIQYHLAGSAAAFSGVPVSKLYLASMVRWAAPRGYRFLHLGGGLGGEKDSLYEFKKGFGSCRFWFDTLQVVHDERVFRDLVERCDAGDSSSFFPPYREGER